jgi:hypothetical protein
MRASNNVRCYQTVTNAFTGICSRANGSVHRTGFTTYEDCDITAADELSPDQADFRSFGHGVSRLNGGYQSACFNHAQSYTSFIIGHGLFSYKLKL